MGLDDLLATVRACRICAEAARPLPHEPRPVLQVSGHARIPIERVREYCLSFAG